MFRVTDLSERLQAALAGRYAIERQVGRGGMAWVYLADDLRHHRHVALKWMFLFWVGQAVTTVGLVFGVVRLVGR